MAISDLATEAFREPNIIAKGATPTSTELAEAVTLMNRFVQSLEGGALGEPMTPMALGLTNVQTPDLIPVRGEDFAGYAIPKNTRLQCNLSAATTVYLDPTPRDGDRFAIVDVAGNFATRNLTVHGNGRQISGATSVTLSTASLVREWFYRDDLGKWVVLTDLVAADTSPFHDQFDDMLIIGTAMRLCPRYGKSLAPESVDRYNQTLAKFKRKYSSSTTVLTDPALARLPSNRSSNAYDSTAWFNRGYYNGY